MKTYIKKYLAIAALSVGIFTACDIAATDPLMDIIKEDQGYIPVVAGWTMRTPTPVTLTPGANAVFDLRYWSEGEIDKIRFFVKIGTAENQMISEQNYVPAYSNITKTDSLLINYTLPASVAVGTPVIFRAEVTNKNLPDYPVGRSLTFPVR